MASIPTLFATALQHHQAGRLDVAEPLYRQILQLDPAHSDAHHFLGIIAHQTGRHVEAVQSMSRAVALNPAVASYHYNLGLAHEALFHFPEAICDYQTAIRLQPDYADAHNNLGNVLTRQDRFDEAATHYQTALRHHPDDADIHFNLGNTLDRIGRQQEAAAHWQQAVKLRPAFPEALNNLGKNALDGGNLDASVTQFREALRLRPDYAGAHANLAHALYHLGYSDEALTHCLQALRLRPDLPEAHLNLGVLLQSQGKLAEAMTHYEEALRLRPQYAEAHVNRALLWLLHGDFARGWAEYEWRWQRRSGAARPFAQPQWNGSALGGQTILLHAEQGFGDTIQFIRYAPLVKQICSRVIIECQPALLRLLHSAAGVDGLVPQGSPVPAFDVYAPLLSLPGIFQTNLANIPALVPYLQIQTALIEHWRHHLESLKGFKVGIVWQGKVSYSHDRWRSLGLNHFHTLAAIPGVQLVSLQKGPAADQLRAACFPILDVSSKLDDFSDTAAAVKNVDLVISCDTAVAHLAGALGMPVWVALPFMPDWRWLLQREDSPWYPTMRLFRQTQLDRWDDVFDRMAVQLRAAVSAPL